MLCDAAADTGDVFRRFDRIGAWPEAAAGRIPYVDAGMPGRGIDDAPEPV